jgi:hypothetical protein
MGSVDWFGLVFALTGLVMTLGGIFEWVWLWRLARGGYLPDEIGVRNTRLLYAIGGTGMTGAGIGLVLQSLLATTSNWMFVIGFVASITLSLIFLTLRNQVKRR